MISALRKISQHLYWRITGVFLLLFLLIGLVYVFITVYTAQRYYSETTQRLNAEVADHLLKEVQPFVGGKVNEESPGKILSYVVLDKKVKLKYV